MIALRRMVVLVLFVALAAVSFASDRVPGKHWMRYVDPEEAGFDSAKLQAAQEQWEELPSSAFIVVADGAVVAAWGDTQRRFMCHSVRKSFLSALYGIYWDRGEIDLNKTLADLGIDDTPDPLLEVERRARILDLLKARSGVFHPAAYAGRTDSADRGSKGAGRYFAYNNWDFNTLATILMQETGDDVFKAFDEHFGRPLGMQDWRVTDGYYHYERDKSRYPAYPFRLSARDAARFGLLFTREGKWGDTRILSKHWVRRSSALYSIDDEVRGYGFMWWIYREPRFARHGMYAALGVGNQMIAALPDSDLVIVNRANTYGNERTPDPELNDLIETVLEARTGKPAPSPELVPLEEQQEPFATTVPTEGLLKYVGEWTYPPKPLGLGEQSTVELSARDGHLLGYSPQSGTFKLYVQEDGSLREEDSQNRYLLIHDEAGEFAGISGPGSVMAAALASAEEGEHDRSAGFLAMVEDDDSVPVEVGRAIIKLVGGKPGKAEQAIQGLIEAKDPRQVEAVVNQAGYRFLGAEKNELALEVFKLNTRVFPESANTWDSLGEVHMTMGNNEEAIRSYEKSLELDENNRNATNMIAKMRGEAASVD